MQVGVQAVGVLATATYTALLTYILLKLINRFIGLRVSKEEEIEGLDIALHEERGYDAL